MALRFTGTGWNERDLATELLERAGVATIAGTDFGAEGAGFIRLSCANSLENIASAIDRIEAFLAGSSPVGGPEVARETA